MKIEHIIEDIKFDIITISSSLADQLKQLYPDLLFTISTPGLEELNTIKSIAINFDESGIAYSVCVLIHTHNGYRVFEHQSAAHKNGVLTAYEVRHPLHEHFLFVLRDIIKRRKGKGKNVKRTPGFYHSHQPLGNTG